jgi:hypothetical protein
MSVEKGGGPYRSAVSGRYVIPRQGKANPSTTVHEAPGKHGSSGPLYRSAISGRYVTNAFGARNPKTTVRDR